MCKGDSDEKNCLVRHLEQNVPAVYIATDATDSFHIMSVEDVSRRRRKEFLCWNLASAMLPAA